MAKVPGVFPMLGDGTQGDGKISKRVFTSPIRVEYPFTDLTLVPALLLVSLSEVTY